MMVSIRTVAAGLLAAAALAGCNGAAGVAPAPPFASIGPWTGAAWRAIGPGLGGARAPASGNACQRGTPACMDAVVGEMSARIDALGCRHLAPFAVMYRQVSREVRASVAARRYPDPPYVAHLDAVFATYYFHALDAWRAGRRDDVPRVWRLAFGAADGRRVTTFGDMLLGMNAHISRDLPFVLADVGLRGADGADATASVVAVNADIERSQAPMLAEIRAAYDPRAAPPDTLPKWIDPDHVGALIARWRLEALENARALIAARTPAARAEVETRIDADAAVRSLLIWRATASPQPRRDAARREAYCAATD
jgi:Family of unknown function (DUF5995)